jgi:hypothetical protein
VRKASTEQDSLPCPKCEQLAERYLSSPAFTFAHVPNGVVPQNTGVSGIDHNWDRVVGRDAEVQWEAHGRRWEKKKKVLIENPGKSRWDLSKTDLESYRVMEPEERKAAETARDLHHKAMGLILDHIKERKVSEPKGRTVIEADT